MKGLFACFTALLLFGGGVLLLPSLAVGVELPWSNNGSPTSPGSPPTNQPSSGPTPGDSKEKSCDRVAAVVSYLDDHGFATRDYIIGVDAIDWNISPSHVDDPFSKPLQSRKTLRSFLESDRPAAAAAREITGSAADGYVPVQFLNPVFYTGNWHWKDHRAVKGGDRMVLAGDVWWLAVEDCKVSGGQSIRAACGNVGLDQLSLVARDD